MDIGSVSWQRLDIKILMKLKESVSSIPLTSGIAFKVL